MNDTPVIGGQKVASPSSRRRRCPGVCPEPVADRCREKQRRLRTHRLRTRQPDERSDVAAEGKRRGCHYERNRSSYSEGPYHRPFALNLPATHTTMLVVLRRPNAGPAKRSA